jgi:RHS repeat-associated protein
MSTAQQHQREPNSANAAAAGQKPTAISAPTISLPKGGGAIRGMGEKFAANPVTGTGSMSVPIATSPGRAGFGPKLSLDYDSGSGNGPFGFGWQLSLPSITRKTDKGLPQYQDAGDSDVFLLSGVEDLVPVDDGVLRGGYVVRRFRPRIEGLFALIERWTSPNDATDVFWRSISRDNVTTFYGKTRASRVARSADESRIFSWLICESYDATGNAILYEYKREDDTDVDKTQANERNREIGANRYLKSIRYGNTRSHVNPAFPTREAWRQATGWLFEVVFDYGEHDPDDPRPNDPGDWICRNDPFSSYRAGFEVRANRLCQRVLMFHHFPLEDIGANCLVRSTDFAYRESRGDPDDRRKGHPIASFIASVTQCGYKRNAGGSYVKRWLPPLELRYQEAEIQHDIREVDADSLENLPVGLDGDAYQWVDLDGEGVSGILAEQASAWFYKRNLSPMCTVEDGGVTRSVATFAPVELVARKPAFAATGESGWQLQDLSGDGQPDLVRFDGPAPGFFERTVEDQWDTFVPFGALPNVNWRDSNLRFVDLTGDGLADLFITEDEVFTWYPSLGETGFASSERTAQALDEERGPRLVLADAEQSIYLADFSGDGLTDLVRIRNGSVCYWPNLGYGRFGAKVTMDRAPWFDAPDQFSQRRIRLADVDGSGLTDIVYLGRGGVTVYFNQSGNGWSAGNPIAHVPRVDNLAAVQVVDLFGNGTACLVWSSPLPGDAQRPMRYLDLMGGVKPHLLIKAANNLGAETHIQYTSSTKFYLQDKAAGRPWITKLPFPVHVVEKMTVTDRWRHSQFSTTYSYHHGYFDGVEREFRGFGRVEQVDVETFGVSAAANADSPYVTDDQTLYQPPIKTITWFHTGAAIDRERILSQFQREYFAAFPEKALPEPDLESAALTAEEWREAMRACKGMTLRQEVYELDVDALDRSGEHVPVRLFSAAMHNCNIRRLQPKGGNAHAVFLVTESEALSYHYELDLRSPPPLEPDPRIQHTLNLSFDKYGNIQQSVAVGYPRVRQFDDSDLAASTDLIREVQRERHVAYTETRYTGDAIDQPPATAPIQFYRLRVPCEVQTYELTGIAPARGSYFELADLRSLALGTRYPASVPTTAMSSRRYHEVPQTAAATMRLVEHARTLFFDDVATGPQAATRFLKKPLALGTLGRLGLPYEQYKLALTDALLDAVFTDGQLDDLAPDGVAVRAKLRDPLASGYVNGNGFFVNPSPEAASEYWMRSGVAGFESDAATHFYLPERYTDAFDNVTTVEYDGRYDLFIRSSRDALGNVMTVEQFDYRVLAPREIRDPNGNYRAVAFDVMGMPVAAAVMGKQRTESGDSLDALPVDLTVGAVSGFLTAVYNRAVPEGWLGTATARYVYDFGANVAADGTTTYLHRPASACGIVRERHVQSGGATDIQVGLEYSDGMGAVLVTKSQAEPDPDSPLANSPLRWIASGKTVLNNKGKPVKQYEPYFSRTEHRFDPAEAAADIGVTPLMYYDAAGRLVRTELPDGTLSRIELSPWHVRTFDANDTVLESAWYQGRGAPSPTQPLAAGASPNTRAAWLATKHAGTPAETILDSLGRAVVAVAHNRVADGAGVVRDERYVTFTRLDAEGKPLWIRDPLAHLVMQYLWPPKPDHDDPRIVRNFSPTGNPNNDIGARTPAYDIAGNLLFQHSMDAGNRWMINDAAGKPMFAWDINERQDANNAFVTEQRVYATAYDRLHRPRATWLRVNDGTATMIERFEYQDARPNDVNNLNGQLVRRYDPSGRAETVRRDFDGNVREVRRRLNNRPREALIDWSANPVASLEAESFAQITEFDALNRMTRQFHWHREAAGSPVTSHEPTYNERGALFSESLTTRLVKSAARIGPGPNTTTTPAIEQIRYNEKGQKTFLALGNGTLTQYEYDRETFRLVQIQTTRPSDPAGFPTRRSNLIDPVIVQQLLYAYDPVGNVTECRDDAYEPVYFQNQQVEPRSRYEYDALYRLTRATGRENGALRGAPAHLDGIPDDANFPILDTDPNALRIYTQTYRYDAAGNIQRVRHDAGLGSWTRDYAYAFEDPAQPASNRLWQTWVGGNRAQAVTYSHDTHGNMRKLAPADPRFNLRWDHRDMLRSLDLGGGGRAYYQYDADKQRTRKRIDGQNGQGGYWERIYLAGYELYRRYGANGNAIVEEIESHHLFEGEQRVLLVDDVIRSSGAANPRPDGLIVRGQTLFRYQYSNHLGSACLELDEGRRLVSYEEYHPYGTSAYRAMKRGIEAPPKRYRYTGMERDEESGLNYHGARYYASWLGRWVSSDPAGLVDGGNSYLFVGGNPIRRIDRNGRQYVDVTKARRLPGETDDALIARLVAQGRGQSLGTSEDINPATEQGLAGQIIQGDFYEGEMTAEGVSANIAIGLIPIVGQVADVRDTVAALGKIIADPRAKLAWMGLAVAAIAWVPGIGDAIKSAAKLGKAGAGELRSVWAAAVKSLSNGAQHVVHERTRSGVKFLISSSEEAFKAVSGAGIYLYHVKNRAGNVIYVGQSGDAIERLAQHLGDKPWFHEIGSFDVVRAGLTNKEATAFEEELIQSALHKGEKLQNEILNPFTNTPQRLGGYPGEPLGPALPNDAHWPALTFKVRVEGE